MLNSDRNKLINLAYGLDNWPRRRLAPNRVVSAKLIESEELVRLNIQEKTDDLVIVLTHAELTDIAETIRGAAVNDEDRLRGKL